MDGETSSDNNNHQQWNSSVYHNLSSANNQFGNTSVDTSHNSSRWNTNPAPYDNQPWNGGTYMDASNNNHFESPSAPFDTYLQETPMNTIPYTANPGDERSQSLPFAQTGGGGHEAVSLPSMMQELSAKMEIVSQLFLSAILAGEDFSYQDNANILSHYSNCFSPQVRITNAPATISMYNKTMQQIPDYAIGTTFSTVNTNPSAHVPPSNMFANNYAGAPSYPLPHTTMWGRAPSAYSHRDNRSLFTNGSSGSVHHQLTSSTDSDKTYTGDVDWRNNHSSVSNGNNNPAVRMLGSSSNRNTTQHSPRVSIRTTKRLGQSDISQPVHNTMFSGSNVAVNGGSFAINMMAPDAGFIILSQAASKEATHDSSERFPPPKCHPKTRMRTIDFFVEWIKTQRPSVLIYWLCAPYGHGKSAVMQTIMDRLVEEGLQHLFAGGFFFGRGRKGRDKLIHLFATIAYQIAIFIPGMREHINNAMLADPTLPSKTADIQLHSLIIKPLFRCADGSHFHHSPTVFIDGLDECDTINSQITALDLITTALHEHHIPLRFLIASRPESHIRGTFDRSLLNTISEQVDLPEDDDEMTAYVRAKFDEIYDNHARIMRPADIQKPWPSSEVIDGLVRRASGQHTTQDCSYPTDASVFNDMDTIYRVILEQCPPSFRSILNIIMVTMVCEDNVWEDRIAEFWQLSYSDVMLVVQTLAAVIDNSHVLSFHHLSFQEFLKDESRSGIFFLPEDAANQKYTARQVAVFKLVLTGDLVFEDSSLVGWCNPIFDEPYGLHEELTPSELLELVHHGQSPAVLEGEALIQWWYMIDGIMVDIFHHSDIFPTSHHYRWSDVDNINRKVVVELYNYCLGIWKGIADTAFAAMDSRLINAIFSMGSGYFKVSDLARVAGMDEEDCLDSLNQHRVLFRHGWKEISMDSFLQLYDVDYCKLDEDGTCRRIRDIREDFIAL